LVRWFLRKHKEFKGILAVLIYGSTVDGRIHSESDIDYLPIVKSSVREPGELVGQFDQKFKEYLEEYTDIPVKHGAMLGFVVWDTQAAWDQLYDEIVLPTSFRFPGQPTIWNYSVAARTRGEEKDITTKINSVLSEMKAQGIRQQLPQKPQRPREVT